MKEDIGRKLMIGEAKAFIQVQGANPNNDEFDSNGGRKANGALCDHHDVPYENSMDWHGDKVNNWVVYQPNVTRRPGFKRRDQHPDPRMCIVGHRKILKDWGRGKPEPTPPPPPTMQMSEELRQFMGLLKMNIRAMGMGPELQMLLGEI